MDKINKMPQVIIRVIFIICIVLSMLIIVSFLFYKNKIPGLFNIKPVVVETNMSVSNEKKGDLLLVKDMNSNEYEIGDIIVFRGDKNKNVLSKIEGIDNSSFILSRNIKVDKNVIQGIKVLKIPLLGYFVMLMQSIVGLIITIILLVISLIWYNSKNKSSNDVSK